MIGKESLKIELTLPPDGSIGKNQEYGQKRCLLKIKQSKKVNLNLLCSFWYLKL